jgi:hypothetical protein
MHVSTIGRCMLHNLNCSEHYCYSGSTRSEGTGAAHTLITHVRASAFNTGLLKMSTSGSVGRSSRNMTGKQVAHLVSPLLSNPPPNNEEHHPSPCHNTPPPPEQPLPLTVPAKHKVNPIAQGLPISSACKLQPASFTLKSWRD